MMDPLQNKGEENLVEGYVNNTHSITVQVVLMHPYENETVYWVLNREEVNAISPHKTPKRRGWSNPGGGVEAEDRVDEKGIDRSSEQIFMATGRRELRDETGFINLDFVRYLPARLEFLMYQKDHTVITLVAELHDFKQFLIKEPGEMEHIKEIEEIERGKWFDLKISPIELFKDEGDSPYFSHIRRTMIVLQRLSRSSRIHPLWLQLAFTFSAYEEFCKKIYTASSGVNTFVAHKKDVDRPKECTLTHEERYEEEYRLWAEGAST